MKTSSSTPRLASVGAVMNRTILLFVAISTISPRTAFSQNLSPFSIRAYFAPQVQYRTLTADALEQAVISERNAQEQASIGFSTGATGEYRLNEHWSVLAGLAYSLRGFQSRPRNVTFANSPQTAPEQPLPEQSFMAYSFNAIDIPLGIQYRFAEMRIAETQVWTAFAALEAAPSIVLSKTKAHWVRTENLWAVEHSLVRNRGFDRFGLLVKASAGVNYALSEHIAARVSGHFQHSLSAVQTQLSAREYLYAAGLELGVEWRP